MSLFNYFKKKREFNRIARDITSIKIQGARNIAKEGLAAYFLFPTKSSKNKLFSLRPTEPMLHKVLNLAEQGISKEKIVEHFDSSQEKINKQVFNLIKDKDIIFTHCHSTNVINALVYSKKKGKKFEVYNTETRPLFQGRRTAVELENAGIKVSMFIDSALGVAIKKGEVSKVFLGADAISKEGVINKIGSELISRIAQAEKIPVYIIADSWKFSEKRLPIEQRELNEVWDHAPKNIKIENPAFEFIHKKYIKSIISELGTLNYSDFLKKVKKN